MNQMPATLVRTVEKPERVRLEFAGDIAVELPIARHLRNISSVKEWVIEFPSKRLADLCEAVLHHRFAGCGRDARRATAWR